jgi:hypothetical protein
MTVGSVCPESVRVYPASMVVCRDLSRRPPLPRRGRVRAALWVLAASAAVLFAPSPARAQTGFSWHVDGGGIVPLSSFISTGIRLDGESTGAGAEAALSTRLVDAYTRPGFEISTTFLLARVELRYAFHRLPWDREETLCAGSGPGVQLPNGAIDDALVHYTCFAASEVVSESVARNPVFLHVLSLGYRVYFLEPGGRLNVYGVGAPGLAIMSYNEDRTAGGVRLGLNVGLGAGLQLALSNLFGLTLEGRYGLLLSGPPATAQGSANRTRALGGSAFDAALNVFHYTTFTLGFQLSFR